MKKLVFFILLPLLSFSQIKIDKAGDFWELKAQSALDKIKAIDPGYYSRVEQVCYKITFWNGKYSTNSGGFGVKGVIVISSLDVKLDDIDDLCAVIVHESLHLKMLMEGAMIPENEEEYYCYLYELGFLRMVPNVNPKLISHAEEQIIAQKKGRN
jgi:hypothetical protein